MIHTTSTPSNPADANSSLLPRCAEALQQLDVSPMSVFYVSRTPSLVSGVSRALPHFYTVSLVDPWDGNNPHAFTPSNAPAGEVGGFEDTVNWLLCNREVQRFIAAHTPAGTTPNIATQKFNRATEQLCEKLGYRLISPPCELRGRLDSKIVTTEIGNRAGVPSVPNVLTRVSSWQDLRKQADRAHLGDRLVLQLPWGDSGMTTFFVNSEADWDRVRDDVVGNDVKVMKFIRHYPLATEAVIMERGTVIGPTLFEVTGHEELTSVRGGWCGSELFPGMVDGAIKDTIDAQIQAFCDALRDEGYHGVLEVSTLLDLDSGECYLGELNARLSGSAGHTNLDAQGQLLPLFAYHIMHYAGVDPSPADIAAINAEIREATAADTWSTLILQNTDDAPKLVTTRPRSGRYRLTEAGSLEFVSAELWPHELREENEVYVLHGTPLGGEIGRDSYLAMLWVRQRLQNNERELTELAHTLVRETKRAFRVKPAPLPLRLWRKLTRRLRREAVARFNRAVG